MLVNTDGVEAKLFAEGHLRQVVGVDLRCALRLKEGVGVRIIGGLFQIRPGHQVEGVNLHPINRQVARFRVPSDPALEARAAPAHASRPGPQGRWSAWPGRRAWRWPRLP